MLKAKRFEEITYADVQALVAAAHAEDHEIDYKQALPEFDKRAAEDKKDLCKDVSAFGNSGGGDILYGIEEGRDDDNKPTGVPTNAAGVSAGVAVSCAVAPGPSPRLKVALPRLTSPESTSIW